MKRTLTFLLLTVFLLALLLVLIPSKPNETIKKDIIKTYPFLKRNVLILNVEHWTLTGPSGGTYYFSTNKSLDELADLLKRSGEAAGMIAFPKDSERCDRYLIVLDRKGYKEYLGLYPCEEGKLKEQNTFFLSDLGLLFDPDGRGDAKRILFPSLLLQVEDLYLFTLVSGQEYPLIDSLPRDGEEAISFMTVLNQFYAQTDLYDVIESNERKIVVSFNESSLSNAPLNEAEKSMIYTGRFSITLDSGQKTLVVDLL